jgi:acetylornithine deacetylase/succinyl-diaminopimelate desuccinylase-like protein
MNQVKALVIAIAALSSLHAAETATRVRNTQVAEIVSKISEQQIASIQKKLEDFQTRNIYSSQDDPQHGIGAARHWIYSQFQSYSPRLQVSFDEHGIKAFGRVYKDVKIFNVIAVLPGSSEAERHVIVSGHYDSMNMIFKTDGNGKRVLDAEGTVAAVAPGVTDDGSGTAAVLELARVMSQYQFRKTIVFIAFAGEEYGLLGSSTYADAAKKRGDVIEGVLNNDIIGSDERGDGSKGNRRINVYSEDPEDSPSRQLARYVRETASRYLPEMDVNLVFRYDRFGRGGDHSPFNANGYAAVRFTTPWENFANQHTATDTFANTAPAFTALVTKVNAAALASLASAPKTPQPVSPPLAPGHTFALPLGRGTSGDSDGPGGYDAEMHWINPNPEPDLAGYAIVIRDTKAPYWEREIFIGNVSQYTIKRLSIDEVALGVRAVDNNGNESLVAAYVNSPYKQRKWETF